MTVGELRGLTVGAGHFARIQLSAWRDVHGARIAGLVSKGDPADVAEVARSAGVPFSGADALQAIEQTSPDFLDICTPPGTHGHYVRLAADLGIPVLCQKPLAPTLEESAALIAYCRDRGIPLFVNENWRWQPWYREIRALIGTGAIGEPYHARMVMRPGDGWGNVPYPEQPYFARMPRLLLAETGTHYIDTSRFLFGDISHVWCTTRTINPAVRGEDYAIAVLTTTNGVTVVYDANRTTYVTVTRSPAYGRMTVEGTEGSIRMDENGSLWLTRRGACEEAHRYTIPSGWKGGSAVAAQQHFVNCLRGTEKPETPAEDYLRSMAAVEACYRSAAHRHTVAVEETLREVTEGTGC
jgi:predicted dehydrogenase